jgi:predicted dehydrogenase/aryl-alcohol dehydrogenase-like predicted oxidoreductase
MAEQLAWGILGTGRIAGIFASGLARSRTGTLVAVGSRTQAAADAFAEKFGAPGRHGSYEALLADPAVEAVYIATPHPAHARIAIEAAEAGKHVLCEKPIAMNHPEAMAIVEAAHRNDVFLMEAFMYRCHPQTARLVELIRSGAIGEVRVIQAAFSFHGAYNPEGRMLSNELGGGGILDVGCYTTSMARLVAGAALGGGAAEPLEVQGVGHVGRTGVDEYAVATLRFPGDIAAELLCGVQVRAENVLRVLGSEGSILVSQPWVPGARTSISVTRHDTGESEQIEVELDGDLYGVEADTVAANLERREASEMTWADTLGNMRTLDRWRQAIGVVHAVERPDGPGQDLPVHGRPLAVREDAPMRYGSIEGVGKRISRLVLGVDNQVTWPQAAVMLDDFYERGGTCFDSAFIYGQGKCEQLLGAWIRNRRVRDHVVILDKGAHTPFCTPEGMAGQLRISLERLQTDYVDIYMLHRDNPEIPVGEFIAALNEQRDAGRVRVFGASNWTLERVEEANRWASAHGLQGFSAVSNNFSLARMIEPVWAGCMAASDPESRAWLTRTQMPLMPWSSQGRGFFIPGRADPENRSDPELVRSWYSEDNFARRDRAMQLATERGVLPIDIALAYVLCQPFPTFPLIGPRQLSETRTSLQALEVELTPDDLRWLDDGGGR